MMKFTVRKTANIISIISECGTIFKTWNEADFTERKLKNQISKITANVGIIKIERTF